MNGSRNGQSDKVGSAIANDADSQSTSESLNNMISAQRNLILALLTAFLSACTTTPSPKSITAQSAALPKLQDRIAFIEQYVTFRRSYLALEYDVVYHNNGAGLVPGPSDWDIRMVAVVPAEQLNDWVPAGTSRSTRNPPAWLASMPNSINTTGVSEWYLGASVLVGIDRVNHTILYWNTTSGLT